MGLKDKQNYRGHEFCAEGRDRERERQIGRERKEKGENNLLLIKI